MNDYTYEQAAHLTSRERPADNGLFDLLDLLAQLHAEQPGEPIAPLLDGRLTGGALALALNTVKLLCW
jgi:hypothetical protein